MKVLLLHDYGTLAGGAEVEAATLRDGLRARGHDARLLASTAGTPGDDLRPEYPCRGATGRWRTALQVANPWAARAARRAVRTFRPDVACVKMFLTQLSPLVLRPLRGVPTIHHVVWYRPICPIGTKLLPDGTSCRVPAGLVCLRNGCLDPVDWTALRVQRALYERGRRAIDLVVANSRAVAARLTAEGIGPVEVLHNGVPGRAQRPPLSDPPIAGFAGRLVREKGVDVLLEAFAAAGVPEARLVVVGDGPERGRLERRAADLGLGERAEFVGWVSRADVERRLDAAWVQAVPSRWEEPFGIVATEAMMRGTAVVASASGGLSEIVVDGRTGLLVPPGDVGRTAAALRRLLGDRALSERMGARGRDRAEERFSQAAALDRWEAVFDRVAARRDGASSR